ncbi:helix-turn-helix domain-containing protein [Gracilimonas sp. BCB1]|uniref:helix-turn-helix domain-containing protein n=1 Tax=Gracilimonas sp. BCB1 TaxID=3152362 RepID=UPI0032D9789D
MEELIILTKSQFVSLIDERLSLIVEEKLGHLQELPSDTSDKELLTNDEAIDFLGVSKSTLQRYRSSGKLKYSKVGNKIFYHRDDIIEMVG